MAGVLRDADAVGATTLLNPYLPHDRRSRQASREEILKAAGDFAKWSKQCRAAGKRFGYHIHGQEFGPAPEGTLFDVLAKESGPDVGFEADVYWVAVGGADPVALMKKYAGRIWFTHLKDMAKGIAPDLRRRRAARTSKVVLGTGQMDVKGILAAGPRRPGSRSTSSRTRAPTPRARSRRASRTTRRSERRPASRPTRLPGAKRGAERERPAAEVRGAAWGASSPGGAMTCATSSLPHA